MTTEKTMEDMIKGPTLVAIDAAKRRAAYALFKSIEATANSSVHDVSSMYDLAAAFTNVSDSVAIPNGGAVETNLRNELQAANDEVAELRAALACIDEVITRIPASAEPRPLLVAWHRMDIIRSMLKASDDGVMAQKVKSDFVPQLDAIRSLLFKSGFHSHDIVGAVETALEMLAEAQKERDSIGEQLDASEKAREALQAGYDAMAGAHADRLAELGNVDALLNFARTWTSYDFEINSRGRRVDVIRALAHRSEVLRSLQDEAAAASLYEGMHGESKDAAISRRIDAQHEKTRSQLAAVIGALVDLMDFWRRGNDMYRRAAGTLDSRLKLALGEVFYQPLVDAARVHRDAGTTSRPDASPVGVAHQDATKIEDVAIDLASAPFPMGGTIDATAPSKKAFGGEF